VTSGTSTTSADDADDGEVEAEGVDAAESSHRPAFLRRHWAAACAAVVAVAILGGALYVRSQREPRMQFFCVAAGAIYEPIGATPQAAIEAWLANPEGGKGRFHPLVPASAWRPIGGTDGVDYHDGNGNCLAVDKVPGGWQVTGDGRG
jgi:hypothetical protein